MAEYRTQTSNEFRTLHAFNVLKDWLARRPIQLTGDYYARELSLAKEIGSLALYVTYVLQKIEMDLVSHCFPGLDVSQKNPFVSMDGERELRTTLNILKQLIKRKGVPPEGEIRNSARWLGLEWELLRDFYVEMLFEEFDRRDEWMSEACQPRSDGDQFKPH